MPQRIRPGATAFFLCLAITAVAVSVPQGVRSHAEMNSSVPADGAVVPVGLEAIELGFSGAMRLTNVKLTRSSDGSDVAQIGGLPKTFVPSAQLSVPVLEPGDYRVSWTGVGKDGHVMTGAFSFTVSPGK